MIAMPSSTWPPKVMKVVTTSATLSKPMRADASTLAKSITKNTISVPTRPDGVDLPWKARSSPMRATSQPTKPITPAAKTLGSIASALFTICSTGAEQSAHLEGGQDAGQEEKQHGPIEDGGQILADATHPRLLAEPLVEPRRAERAPHEAA